MKITNAEIFKGEIFNLPKLRGSDSIVSFINNIFKDYMNEVLKFNGDLAKELAPKIPFIQDQISLIKESLSSYLNGFPSAAYGSLSKALKLLLDADFLPIQKTELDAYSSPFYRVRISNNKTLKREEFFHIPFEIREKVSTQRYSIPGLPCLYIADSVFVCWEELGRPNIDSFHVSRVDLSSSKLKFLYFNTSSSDILKQCFPGKNKDGRLLKLVTSFLCYWPILAACSLVVKKQDEVFKPEYIIPQLLLQWIVSEQKVDGVVYRSNRIKISNHNIGSFKNVVIPVRKIEEQGFCSELKKRIKLTNPVSYQLMEIAGIKQDGKIIKLDDLRRAMYIELIEGEKTVYSDTVFGKLESKLDQLQTKLI